MNLFIETDLGHVTIEAHSKHCTIEHVWIRGEDYAERTLREAIVAILGDIRLTELVAQAALRGETERKHDGFENTES